MQEGACTSVRWNWDSKWPAPAKLNLFLHVVGRRADGYHLLQSAMHYLDFSDTISFTPAKDLRLVDNMQGLAPQNNLCLHAARLLQKECCLSRGAIINLQKILPTGGGLGGGSSDAATVLVALNHLWGTGLNRCELQQLGLQLGADVPFFIFGENAFVNGIGEQLQSLELPDAANTWYLLLFPPLSVSTASVFQALQLKENTPVTNSADWRPGLGVNDLTPIVTKLFPSIQRHLDWLNQYANARLSGSGATVFAEFPDQAGARAVFDRLLDGMHGRVTQGLARHPLSGLLD